LNSIFKTFALKTYITLLLFFIVTLGFAQNNYVVKTEDGRRVLLKADYTWKYIDLQPLTLVDSAKMNDIKSLKSNSCNIPSNFEEPLLNKKIQAQLKKGRATISHVKKKVAKDYNCDVMDVILLSVSEQKSKAVYNFCIKGKEVAYKRIGTTIVKKVRLF
jgi:hypothetical protein